MTIELTPKLAVISNAKLHLYNNCILSLSIRAEYESGGHQEAGGITFDDYNKDEDKRVGTAFGCELIRQALLFFGVNDLSEVKDHICYVLCEGDGFSAQPRGLRNLDISTNDRRQKEIIYKDVLAQFKDV